MRNNLWCAIQHLKVTNSIYTNTILVSSGAEKLVMHCRRVYTFHTQQQAP
jgi:hypothetical protein